MEFFNKLINDFDIINKEETNEDTNVINNLIKENEYLNNEIIILNKKYNVDETINNTNIINNLIKENEKLLKINENIINDKKHLKVIHKETNKYEIIKTDINTLNSTFNIVNWSKNRPHCSVRVNEISNYYKNNNIKLIPGIIYTWFNNDKYNILDGLHRYQAALKLNKNIKLILHINYSLNEQDIIDEFININKSIAIPSIYLENDTIKKNVCQSIVDKLCINYSQFISSSRKHLIYNFNRDLLIEYFSNFNLNYNIENLDNKVYEILITLNKKAKHNVITGNISHPKKCNKYDFYLFYLEREFIKKEVEKYINLLK